MALTDRLHHKPGPARAGEPQMRSADIRRILTGSMIAMFLAALDQTIVVTALPTIAADLGGADRLSWVITSYLVAATTTSPLYGRLSDVRGRRPALFLAIGLFISGSIVSATAQSMDMLIAGRVLQGLGAGGLIAIPMTIMGDMIPPRERAAYQVYVAAVYATSSMAGPVLGGVLSDLFHWSMIFWLNLPVAAIALAIAAPALKRLPQNHQRRRLDLAGAGLLVCATVLTLMTLSWTGPQYGFGSLPTLSFAALAALAWLALLHHLNRAPEPLIPLQLLRNPVIANAILAAFFAFGVFIGLCVMAPLYFELALGFSPSGSGVMAIPLMAGTVTGATLAGRYMARSPHYKRGPLLGLPLAMIAALALALFLPALPEVGIAIALGLISLGIGTILPVATVAVQNAVAGHQLGTATAVGTFARQLGAAFIVALFTAVAIGGDRADLAVASSDTMTGPYQTVFILSAAGLAFALVFLWFMKEVPLRTRADD